MHQEWVAHLQADAGIVADHIPHEVPIECKETLSLLFVPLIWPSTHLLSKDAYVMIKSHQAHGILENQ